MTLSQNFQKVKDQFRFVILQYKKPLISIALLAVLANLGVISLITLVTLTGGIVSATIIESKNALISKSYTFVLNLYTNVKEYIAKLYRVKEAHKNDKDGALDDLIETVLSDAQNASNGKVLPGTDLIADRIAQAVTTGINGAVLINPAMGIAHNLAGKASEVLADAVLESNLTEKKTALEALLNEGLNTAKVTGIIDVKAASEHAPIVSEIKDHFTDLVEQGVLGTQGPSVVDGLSTLGKAFGLMPNLTGSTRIASPVGGVVSRGLGTAVFDEIFGDAPNSSTSSSANSNTNSDSDDERSPSPSSDAQNRSPFMQRDKVPESDTEETSLHSETQLLISPVVSASPVIFTKQNSEEYSEKVVNREGGNPHLPDDFKIIEQIFAPRHST